MVVGARFIASMFPGCLASGRDESRPYNHLLQGCRASAIKFEEHREQRQENRAFAMRIMIVTDQYPPMVGGVPNVTHGLATDFAARGHEVVVAAPSYGPRDAHRVEDNVQIYRFSSFEWPTYEELRIPFLPILPFRRLLKRFDPDIIHVHSPVVLG